MLNLQHLLVQPARATQPVVRAALHDAATVKHQYRIHTLHEHQTMGNQ